MGGISPAATRALMLAAAARTLARSESSREIVSKACVLVLDCC